MRIFQKIRKEKFAKYKYEDKECDFCSKEVIKDQGIKKLATENWLVLASKYPYLDGNLMIVPKRHVIDFDELTDKEWQEFFEVLKNVKAILSKIFQTDSFNIALNLGENSGASIKHLHWQIVPRPKKLNPNALTVFNDFHFVTMAYKELIEKIEKIK